MRQVRETAAKVLGVAFRCRAGASHALRFGADGLCIVFGRDGPEARRVAAPDKRGVVALGANEHSRKRRGGRADVTAVGANDSGEHEDS